MVDSNYWSGRVSRRTALRGTGVGIVGLAGAALIGCGGKKSDTATTGEANRLAEASKGGAVSKAETGGTPVPKDQVRVKPG